MAVAVSTYAERYTGSSPRFHPAAVVSNTALIAAASEDERNPLMEPI